MEKENETGYCNPPKENRFKPGQSGNPSGRPKGSKNLDTIFMEALDTKIVVKENGKTYKKSAKEVIIKRIVHNAVAGDFKSSIFLFNRVEKIEDKKEEQSKYPRIIFCGEDKFNPKE